MPEEIEEIMDDEEDVMIVSEEMIASKLAQGIYNRLVLCPVEVPIKIYIKVIGSLGIELRIHIQIPSIDFNTKMPCHVDGPVTYKWTHFVDRMPKGKIHLPLAVAEQFARNFSRYISVEQIEGLYLIIKRNQSTTYRRVEV